ncbi:MAG: hypothetical protein MI748_15990 [Opitutales bacterium]|nr:hypothetical protein [Opitutales bacterium]
MSGRVVIDEIQLRLDLFPLLRYLVDKQKNASYLIFGRASRDLILFLHLSGFALDEIGVDDWRKLWIVYPGKQSYSLADPVEVITINDLESIF